MEFMKAHPAFISTTTPMNMSMDTSTTRMNMSMDTSTTRMNILTNIPRTFP